MLIIFFLLWIVLGIYIIITLYKTIIANSDNWKKVIIIVYFIIILIIGTYFYFLKIL